MTTQFSAHYPSLSCVKNLQNNESISAVAEKWHNRYSFEFITAFAEFACFSSELRRRRSLRFPKIGHEIIH